MYLVIIAWAYVVLLMAVAESLSARGTWLGAFFTLMLYGVLPLSVVIYLMGTPLRRRRREQQEAAAPRSPSGDTPAPDTAANAPPRAP